jgi:prolyl-tRNA synthetase
MHISSRRSISDGRLRLSNIWVPAFGESFKESPHFDSNAQDGNTHLLRAGYVRQSHAGVLGLRVLEKIERLLDSHMTLGVGAGKVALSNLSSVDLWHQSGRLNVSLQSAGHEFLAVRDRPGQHDEEEKFILAPTCEEEITTLARARISWGEALPLRLYQIERKYRNEMRPRKGLLRSKEFVMKDLYTFDADQTNGMKSYELVRAVYNDFFESLGVPFLVAEADSGNMGGNLSHEYHYVSDLGEDTVWTCSSCKFTANDEVLSKDTKDEVPSKDVKDLTHSCPKCKTGSLIPHNTIEIGHTFFLGERYTSKFDCRVNPSNLPDTADTKNAFAQMGCYGIGVSRLVGALAAMCQEIVHEKGDTQVRLHWPRKIAPFDAVVLSNRKKHPEELNAVYDRLKRRAGGNDDVDAVLDDRPSKSLIFKIKDAEMHGIPVACVLGSAWEKDRLVEVRSNARGNTQVENVPLEMVRETVERFLEPEI